MIIEAMPDGLDSNFDWKKDNLSLRFCSIQMVDYLYHPFVTMYVDSWDLMRRALHSIEEESLMYMVNELIGGKSAEIKDVDLDKDLVVISKNTPLSFVDDVYVNSDLQCWLRRFEHEGDLYNDVDLIVRNGLVLSDKIPVAMRIGFLDRPSSNTGESMANISAAIIESQADKLNFEGVTVHVVKRDKKISTLDILLGMQ